MTTTAACKVYGTIGRLAISRDTDSGEYSVDAYEMCSGIWSTLGRVSYGPTEAAAKAAAIAAGLGKVPMLGCPELCLDGTPGLPVGA